MLELVKKKRIFLYDFLDHQANINLFNNVLIMQLAIKHMNIFFNVLKVMKTKITEDCHDFYVMVDTLLFTY